MNTDLQHCKSGGFCGEEKASDGSASGLGAEPVEPRNGLACNNIFSYDFLGEVYAFAGSQILMEVLPRDPSPSQAGRGEQEQTHKQELRLLTEDAHTWPQVRALSCTPHPPTPTPRPLLIPTQVEDLQRSPRERVMGGSDCEGMCILSRLTNHHPQKEGGIPFPCGDHPSNCIPRCIPLRPGAVFWALKAFAAARSGAIWLRLPLRGQACGQLAAEGLFYQSTAARCWDELLGRAASAEPGILVACISPHGSRGGGALAQTLSLHRAGCGGLQHQHVLGPSCMVQSPTGGCSTALGLVSAGWLGPTSDAQQDCGAEP